MLDKDGIIAYVLEHCFLAHGEGPVSCREIGDGNMNFIYRVKRGEESVIFKQAGDMARLSSGRPIVRERNRREARALILQNEIWPGSAPEVYRFDEDIDAMVMEDLSDYAVMRGVLLDGGARFDGFATRLGQILAANFRATSDLMADHVARKNRVRDFINPELCEISERLVFTEPIFNRAGANCVEAGNEDLVRSIVYTNEDLQREVGKLKWRFMTSSEAFIHGDLHTGSIFMRADDIKLFDSEFAFFGPAGYDLGNVLAHLLFARAHARYTGDDACASWVEAQLGQLVETFARHLAGASIPDETDPFAPALEPWVLRNVLSDAAGYCGTELLRRVVGVAKVRDLTTLEPVARADAERELLEQAVALVLNRAEYADPQSFGSLVA